MQTQRRGRLSRSYQRRCPQPPQSSHNWGKEEVIFQDIQVDKRDCKQGWVEKHTGLREAGNSRWSWILLGGQLLHR